MVAVNRALLLVAQVSAKQKRQFLESYDKWSVVPIDDVPTDKAKASYQAFEVAIGVLRSGENWMDLRYDLGLEDMSSQEKTATLLPEYQEMRDLARLLCMRARVASAEKRWDDAISDLRLGFRLSEVASHGTDTLLSRFTRKKSDDAVIESYSNMTFWLTANPTGLFKLKDSWFPSWLNIASGISVTHSQPHKTEILIGLDFNLKRIKTRSIFLKHLLHLVDRYKFPAPAIRLAPGFIGYGLYF